MSSRQDGERPGGPTVASIMRAGNSGCKGWLAIPRCGLRHLQMGPD